jgi:hypothetical protein
MIPVSTNSTTGAAGGLPSTVTCAMNAPTMTTASSRAAWKGVARKQQAIASSYFQKAGEIAEPLAEANLVEQVDHCGCTGRLGAAGPYKSQGDKTGNKPESAETSLAGSG